MAGEAPGAPAYGGRFAAGDPLRAVAALSVVLFHVAYFNLYFRGEARRDVFPPLYGELPSKVLADMQLGLYVFFALSGYLIGRPFIRAFVLGSRAPAVRPYLRNRVMRVVPPLWLVFTVILVLQWPPHSSPTQVAAVYGFLQTYHDSRIAFRIGQAWTLSVEMAYYLLVPLIALALTWLTRERVGPRARLGIVIAGLVAVAAASLEYAERAHGVWGARSVPAVLYAFVPGLLLAAVEMEAAPRIRNRRVGIGVAVLLAMAGVACIVGYTNTPFWRVKLHDLLAAAGPGCLVAAALVPQWVTGGCPRLLDNPALRWVGVRSYSLYLVHVAVLFELRSLTDLTDSRKGSFAILLAVGVPMSLAVAALSYRFVELPLLRRRERWRTRARGVAAPTR
jgi:peptidoglycan/LPS O-acetylase OafA/YrhL